MTKKYIMVMMLTFGLMMALMTGCDPKTSEHADETKEATTEAVTTEQSTEVDSENSMQTGETIDLDSTESMTEAVDDDFIYRSNAVKDISYVANLLYSTQEKAQAIDDEVNQGLLNQFDLNDMTEEEYKLWDDALNEIWGVLRGKLAEDKFQKLRKDQIAWNQRKETKIAEAGKEAEGGSMQPMLENMEGARLTRKRCYKLAAKLGTKFTYELVKTYGLNQGKSNLSFSIDVKSLKEKEKYYLADVVIGRPITLPGNLEAGDTYSFVLNDLKDLTETVTYGGEDLIGESGVEYYCHKNEGESRLTLMEGSDDRVDCPFYKGQIKISKKAKYRVDIMDEEESFLKKESLSFNTAVFHKDGVVTKMIYYGD